jgi:hypothetical protein
LSQKAGRVLWKKAESEVDLGAAVTVMEWRTDHGVIVRRF